MRNRLIVLSMMLCFALPASAQVGVSVGIQVANVSVSVSTYPNLVRVPGYPVYYAPGINSNYFFYDGMYWIFEADRWYSSFWYNGPWILVEPEFIPVFILRVPVRYYRLPPAYFVSWQANSPPRWDEHWGRDWAQRRSGWDSWDRQSAPAPAPLPTYQRNYSGDRYPSADQQAVLRDRNYRYQPSDPLVSQQSRAVTESRPDRAPRGKTELPEQRGAEPQAAPPSPAPAAREPAPADRQAPRSSAQRQRETNMPPPAALPSSEPSAREPVPAERQAPRSSPQPQRETNMRPPDALPGPAPSAREPVPADRQAPRSSPQSQRETNMRPPDALPGPAPTAREPAPADRQAPQQQRARERPEQQGQPMSAPRSEERPVPRSSTPAPREMQPQAEPKQQHVAPPREDRPSSGPGESGQRGQQGQKEKSDERGPDRGR